MLSSIGLEKWFKLWKSTYVNYKMVLPRPSKMAVDI